jgi:hypothetical protein
MKCAAVYRSLPRSGPKNSSIVRVLVIDSNILDFQITLTV